jgi:hypothetical protein
MQSCERVSGQRGPDVWPNRHESSTTTTSQKIDRSARGCFGFLGNTLQFVANKVRSFTTSTGQGAVKVARFFLSCFFCFPANRKTSKTSAKEEPLSAPEPSLSASELAIIKQVQELRGEIEKAETLVKEQTDIAKRAESREAAKEANSLATKEWRRAENNLQKLWVLQGNVHSQHTKQTKKLFQPELFRDEISLQKEEPISHETVAAVDQETTTAGRAMYKIRVLIASVRTFGQDSSPSQKK